MKGKPKLKLDYKKAVRKGWKRKALKILKKIWEFKKRTKVVRSHVRDVKPGPGVKKKTIESYRRRPRRKKRKR